MKILRISRTYPNIKQRTIGLQTFEISKHSEYHSIIFSKKSKFLPIRDKKITNFEIDYKEYGLSKNYNLLQYFWSIITKFNANLKFYKEISQRVNFNKVKLIHIHNLNFLLCGFLLKKKFNKKIYLSIGGTDILRLKNKFLFGILIKKTEKIFSVSNDLKKKFIKIYPNSKCYFISNGVDLEYFKFKKLKKKNVLLAVGNIRWQKNYSLLIETAEKIFKKNSLYKLIICGNFNEKDEYNKIKNLIAQKKLQKKIILKGFQKIASIKELYYKSKILVLSSSSEGLPKVILEAISCGTPVVSTDVGDNKIILKNCGIVIRSNNSEKLYLAINKIINSKRIYRKLITKCYKERLNYDWKKIAQNIHKQY